MYPSISTYDPASLSGLVEEAVVPCVGTLTLADETAVAMHTEFEDVIMLVVAVS